MGSEANSAAANGEQAPATGAANGDAAKVDAATAAQIQMMQAAALGDIVSLMMASPSHREAKLKDVARLVGPAVATRQYMVAKAALKEAPDRPLPVAAALWASVSDEIDARLRSAEGAPAALTPEEWRSGEHLWLVDLIAAPGLRRQAMTDLENRVAKGRPIFVKLRRDDGVFEVATIAELLSRAEAEQPAAKQDAKT